MIADLKFAVRMLAHSRGFTVTALIVLTLGIGATTTMFSATNAVLLKPLPYPDPDRMVVVRETRAQAGFEKTVVAAREYLDWTRGSKVLEDATIVDYPGLAVVAGDQPAVRLGLNRGSSLSKEGARRLLAARARRNGIPRASRGRAPRHSDKTA